jgi:hypothetical protein
VLIVTAQQGVSGGLIQQLLSSVQAVVGQSSKLILVFAYAGVYNVAVKNKSGCDAETQT